MHKQKYGVEGVHEAKETHERACLLARSSKKNIQIGARCGNVT